MLLLLRGLGSCGVLESVGGGSRTLEICGVGIGLVGSGTAHVASAELVASVLWAVRTLGDAEASGCGPGLLCSWVYLTTTAPQTAVRETEAGECWMYSEGLVYCCRW